MVDVSRSKWRTQWWWRRAFRITWPRNANERTQVWTLTIPPPPPTQTLNLVVIYHIALSLYYQYHTGGCKGKNTLLLIHTVEGCSFFKKMRFKSKHFLMLYSKKEGFFVLIVFYFILKFFAKCSSLNVGRAAVTCTSGKAFSCKKSLYLNYECWTIRNGFFSFFCIEIILEINSRLGNLKK